MDKPMTDFDKRIVHRSVRKGLLGSEEVKRYDDELPDASDKAEVVRPEDLEEEKRVRPAMDAAPSEPTEAAEADSPAEGEAPGGEDSPSGAAGEDASGESGGDPSDEEGADPSGQEV